MREVEIFSFGDSLENVFNELKNIAIKCQDDCSCKFNGTYMYSTDSLNDVYKRVTGKTKEEFDTYLEELNKSYEKHKEEHEAIIPELTNDFIKLGHKKIAEKYWEIWDKMVPIRLNDIYEGMELYACLEIIDALNSCKTFDVAEEVINNQSHSGMSYALVCSMVKSLHDNGIAFVDGLKRKSSTL